MMKKIKIKTINGKVIAQSKAKGMTIKKLTEKHRHKLAYADLSDVDLSGINLFRANLSGANLFQANMRAVSLVYADLSDVDLSYADLFDTDLFRSNLSDTDLSAVNLSNSDLSYSNLIGANLFGADLTGVNLLGATLYFTNLDDTKLTGIKGYSEIYEIFLELCRRQPTKTFTSKEWMIIGQLSLHRPCWDQIKRRYGKTALSIARKLAKAGWDEYYKKYKVVLK